MIAFYTWDPADCAAKAVVAQSSWLVTGVAEQVALLWGPQSFDQLLALHQPRADLQHSYAVPSRCPPEQGSRRALLKGGSERQGVSPRNGVTGTCAPEALYWPLGARSAGARNHRAPQL